MVRVVIALGGNAIWPAGSRGTAPEQQARIVRTMTRVADVVEAGHEVVLTHGNGPQVGAMLLRSVLAQNVVPPVPLDWCVAQTQASIGFVAANALSQELERRHLSRPVIPLVSRVLVSSDDPAWTDPSKPIGPLIKDEDEMKRLAGATGWWWSRVDGGWRRLVASPEPIESLDIEPVRLLLDHGAVVIANGGGGVPVVRDDRRAVHGVEAVIDKDLSAGLLAQEVAAEALTILTDVPGAAVAYGTPHQRWLGEVDVDTLRRLQREGHFATGSMGPKVEACCRFIEGGGAIASIGALDQALGVMAGREGTHVTGGTR